MADATRDLTVVVGLARSGIGAARLLNHLGYAVLVIESQSSPELETKASALRQAGIDVQLGVPLHGDAFAALGTTPAAVVVSPGIRWDHPTLVELRNSGVSTKGEMELAFQASGDVPWIGITGTNGKTTVTHLVSHLLQHAGLDAPMGGNVGFSGAELVLERLERGDPQPNWLVMELSSYQIESAPRISPRVGIWTTLTPDHLERHGTIEAYRAIKRSL
uniref:Mur ligase family protein n=1 Tax=Cyanobium sp. TaxID=2164130 RepID=UPI00404A087E